MLEIAENPPRVVDAVRAFDLCPPPEIENEGGQHAIVWIETQDLIEVRRHQLALEALRLLRRQPRMTAVAENRPKVLDAVCAFELILDRHLRDRRLREGMRACGGQA